MKFKEHDIVRLISPSYGHKEDETGTIIHCYKDGWFEVEFANNSCEVRPDQMELVKRNPNIVLWVLVVFDMLSGLNCIFSCYDRDSLIYTIVVIIGILNLVFPIGLLYMLHCLSKKY